jgi:hypothetical protein
MRFLLPDARTGCGFRQTRLPARVYAVSPLTRIALSTPPVPTLPVCALRGRLRATASRITSPARARRPG